MTSHLVGEQFGDYRLILLIGRGGFADVYLGEHTRHQTLVAVKVLHTRLEHGNVKSFLNEARSFRLRHPHIVQMLDFGLEDDVPFLVMEYAPNGSLRKLYPKGTQLQLGMIRRYVKHIASALQYAHHEGVIHRDIKPDNMLVGKQGELLLSDFGIASLAHTTGSMSEADQAGTVPYMAPEQLRGRPRPASDQYALGIVVYEWICGTRPFHGTFAEISSQHLSAPPSPLRKRVPTQPIDVEHVVMTALAKDPHRRFPSIAAFASAFEHACRQPAAERPLHQKMDTPLPAISREQAVEEHPMPVQTTKQSIEESPAFTRCARYFLRFSLFLLLSCTPHFFLPSITCWKALKNDTGRVLCSFLSSLLMCYSPYEALLAFWKSVSIPKRGRNTSPFPLSDL